LVAHFAQEAGVAETTAFDDDTLMMLARQYWRGNVRELRNAVESALAMGQLSLDSDVATYAGPPSHETPLEVASEELDYKRARAKVLHLFEREFLTRLLGATRGNASEAARKGRMDRPYLLSLLRKHGLR
jgi:DNA-binding NtrC family response regulator